MKLLFFALLFICPKIYSECGPNGCVFRQPEKVHPKGIIKSHEDERPQNNSHKTTPEIEPQNKNISLYDEPKLPENIASMDESKFIDEINRVIYETMQSWKKWPTEPQKEFNNLKNQLSNSGATDEQKKIFNTLIEIALLNIEEKLAFQDSRQNEKLKQKYGENFDLFKKLADSHVNWLMEKNKDLIKLLTGKNETSLWLQVTPTMALETIEGLRRSLKKGDSISSAKYISDYLIMLTEAQRENFAKNLINALKSTPNNKDKGDENYNLLKSLALGANTYFKNIMKNNSINKELDPLAESNTDLESAIKERLSAKLQRGKALYDATLKYIELKDGKYFINENGQKRFEDEISNFNPDSLVAFAIGLKNTNYKDYGERLLLALSLKEGNGNRILPTQVVNPKHSDEPKFGGIFFEARNGISQSNISTIVEKWNNNNVSPRSHSHIYQRLNSVKELPTQERKIWFLNNNGEILSSNINAEKHLKSQSGFVVNFEEPPDHSSTPISSPEKIQSNPTTIIPNTPLNESRFSNGVFKWSPPNSTTYNESGSWYKDFLSHMVDQNVFPDQATISHEGTHGINSYLRNLKENIKFRPIGGGVSVGRTNAFYLGNNIAILMEEPNKVKLSDCKVPESLKGYRHQTYLINQQRYFENEPLYILDEFIAYINGAKAAYETQKNGTWTAGRSDVMFGPVEFISYGLTLLDTIEKKEPEFLSKTPQFKETLAFMVEEAMKLYSEAQNDPKLSIFKWEKADTILRNLRTSSDAEELRNITKKFFGSGWTRSVLGF